MESLHIDLGSRSYPILIGTDLLSDATLLKKHVTDKVMIVSNETVAPLYLRKVIDALGNTPNEHIVLPDGESYKNLDTINDIFEGLLENGFDRGCTLIALGGGVIGDMTGFAAASYQRGVNFIQIPTTLLAQVDSSVGGKTGVNHKLGKNMIGAFHQPVAVIADMSTLDTLPERELIAGLAEVIKYGFIVDEAFFSWLENAMPALLKRDPAAIAYAVKRSCEIKAEIVAADEHERGQRALLNFGHTFGHAIEAANGYGNWLHGEAIGAGMAVALDMSKRSKLISTDTVSRGLALIQAVGLPIEPPASMSKELFLKFMQRDKKVSEGQLRLILLNAIGSAFVSSDFKEQDLHDTLENCTQN